MTEEPLTPEELTKLGRFYTPVGGGVDESGAVFVLMRDQHGVTLRKTRSAWRDVAQSMVIAATEDELVFGAGTWVYCSQHMKPHQTGWCGVSARDKLGLGDVKNIHEAIDKCRLFHLPLSADRKESNP